MRQTEDKRIIRLSFPQEECGGGSRFCDGVGHGILDRNADGYFWDWKKELAVSGAVESYLVILSQLRRLPPLQVVSNSKFVSVGVGSLTDVFIIKHYITEVKKLNKFCQKSYRTFFQCTDNVFLAYNGKEK